MSTDATTTGRIASDAPATSNTPKPASRRGFASMDPQRLREIAAMGGRAAHEQGRAHQFTSEEAREAGPQAPGHEPVVPPKGVSFWAKVGKRYETRIYCRAIE